MAPLLDLKGRHDSSGYVLHATEIAVADEIAGAAELVTGKTRGDPLGDRARPERDRRGSGQDLLMPAERDLFR